VVVKLDWRKRAGPNCTANGSARIVKQPSSFATWVWQLGRRKGTAIWGSPKLWNLVEVPRWRSCKSPENNSKVQSCLVLGEQQWYCLGYWNIQKHNRWGIDLHRCLPQTQSFGLKERWCDSINAICWQSSWESHQEAWLPSSNQRNLLQSDAVGIVRNGKRVLRSIWIRKANQ
jgi:hypothetical protein